MQCAFLLWCMSPLEGSSVIYHRIIRPYFLKHESAIDDAVRSVLSRLDIVYRVTHPDGYNLPLT